MKAGSRFAALGVGLALLFGGIAWAQAPHRNNGPDIPLNDAVGQFWSLATQADAGNNQRPVVVTTASQVFANAPVAGSVTTGGTFQQALATSVAQNGCTIQNTSAGVLFVFVGGTAASEAASFQVPAAGYFSCNQGGSTLQNEIQVTSATTGATFVVVSW